MTTPSVANGPGTSNGNGSVIHDIGYKPYTGPRLSRPHIVRALYFFSLRSAFGFGRGARARVIPLLTFGAMMLPAAVSIYKVASVGGDPALSYTHYAIQTSLLLILFVAVAAPELVSRDLRHHTLPLYFSRPLRRADYPLAKLLALATAIILFEGVPLVVMYLGTIASSTTGSGVWGQTKALVPGLLVALAYGLAFAPLTLLISSISGRRALATGAIAILFLATIAISQVLESVGSHTTMTVNGVPHDPGEPISAPPDSDGNAPDVHETTTYDSIARNGGLVDPLHLVEGTRIWALHATDGDIPDPESTGPLYGLELLALTGLTTGGLFLRYRKVGVA
jgi:ABC-2 type transport system permease protein